MATEYKYLKPDEIEINIATLLRECKKRLTQIIVTMLIMAFLVPMAVYVIDTLNYNEQKEVLDYEFSTIEKQEIDNYFKLKKRLKYLDEYKANSILMKLDSTKVDEGQIQYYVKSETADKYDIANLIKTYVNSGGLASELSKLNDFPESRYIEEIIIAEIMGEELGLESCVLNIHVLGLSQAECQKYVEQISSIIADYSKNVVGKAIQHELVEIFTTYSVKHVEDVRVKQEEYNTDLVTTTNSWSVQYNALSQLQLSYIADYENADENEEILVTIEEPKFSIIYAVIGAFLGGLFAVGVVCVKTLFSGRLQSSKEMGYRWKIKRLANLRNDSNKNKELLEAVVGEIRLTLEYQNLESVAFTGTTSKLQSEEIGQIVGALNEMNIKTALVPSLLAESGGLGTIKGLQNVIIVEELCKSRIEDIYEEINKIEEVNSRVVGYITFEN